MSRNSGEVRVPQVSEIFIAPVGTAMPVSLATPSAPWVGLGYTSDDGLVLNDEPSVEGIMSAQSAHPVREVVTERTTTMAFTLLQWNEDTLELAFGGGETEDLGGGVTAFHAPGADDALPEHAVLAIWKDGDNSDGAFFGRANVREAVEVNVNRTSATALPITVSALGSDDDEDGPWSLLSDHISGS